MDFFYVVIDLLLIGRQWLNKNASNLFQLTITLKMFYRYQ